MNKEEIPIHTDKFRNKRDIKQIHGIGTDKPRNRGAAHSMTLLAAEGY